MQSLTKVEISKSDIEALSKRAFGSRARLVASTPATEGWYNAGYRLSLAGAGPERAFLKVAPPATTPVLTYEQGLMRAEAAVLRRLADAAAPHVPELLAEDFSHSVVDRNCLFMGLVEGRLFSDVRASMTAAERLQVRRSIGRLCGAAHRLTAERFGYPAQPLLQGVSWREAFGRFVAALVADARRFDAPLDGRLDLVEAAFAAALDLLDAFDSPRLTHFDLWDGNVLVRLGEGGWELAAVIDWERAFFGDPLADLVCLTLTTDANEQAALMEGLAEGGAPPPVEQSDDPRRLALYRAYLWLIMIVEAGPRGFGGSIRAPASSAARRLARDLDLATAGRFGLTEAI